MPFEMLNGMKNSWLEKSHCCSCIEHIYVISKELWNPLAYHTNYQGLNQSFVKSTALVLLFMVKVFTAIKILLHSTLKSYCF